MEPREHHISVSRTARYWMLGESSPGVRDVWFVLHGHGQLAFYFLRPFHPLAAADRLIVAPEALSRFYAEPDRPGPPGRVGASWMTREDRLAEIADYVRYLDDLYAEVFARVPRGAVRVTALGFSQGAATAARWACRGTARVDRLVLWAGQLPPELGDQDDRRRLGAMDVVRVLGETDPFARPEIVAAEDARAQGLGLTAPVRRFAGGHELDEALVLELAR